MSDNKYEVKINDDIKFVIDQPKELNKYPNLVWCYSIVGSDDQPIWRYCDTNQRIPLPADDETEIYNMGGNIVIEYTGESFSSTIFMTEGILSPLVKAARKR